MIDYLRGNVRFFLNLNFDCFVQTVRYGNNFVQNFELVLPKDEFDQFSKSFLSQNGWKSIDSGVFIKVIVLFLFDSYSIAQNISSKKHLILSSEMQRDYPVTSESCMQVRQNQVFKKIYFSIFSLSIIRRRN